LEFAGSISDGFNNKGPCYQDVKILFGHSKNTNMEKVWNKEFLRGLEELSVEETNGIIGGESLWYWVGYGIGSVGHFLS
jgi:hypothetical protein